jgi:hypothetical protein
MGTDKMDKMLRVYFERWKFKHPRGTDFLAVLQQELATSTDSITAHNTLALFNKGIFSTAILDYAVTRITNEQSIAPQGVFGQNATDLTYKDGSGATKLLSKVTVQRKGDWVFPVEVLVRFEDGSTQTLYWSGEDGMKIFEISAASPVVSAQIDPQRNISLDIDLNNNSLTLQPAAAPLWKYAAKVLFWIQQLFQTIGFLM